MEDEIKTTNIVAEFHAIQEKCSAATDIAILTAIGKAVGIKRLVVTKSDPVKRPRKKKAEQEEVTEV